MEDRIICAGKTATGKLCKAIGWLPHEGNKYCSFHDPLKGSRTAAEYELYRSPHPYYYVPKTKREEPK